MFKRQTSGSVVCASCGYLVGVKDERCYHCGRRNPGLWGFAPALRNLGHDLGFVPFVTGTCIVIYILTLIWPYPLSLGQPSLFGFLAPDFRNTVVFGASGALPIFGYHRWWTVLSAGWLHGSLLHIVFNLMFIRNIAPAVAEMYGPARMIIIYTVGSIVGFALTSVAGYMLLSVPVPAFLQGARVTLGASASGFGLLGALVYYGRRSGSSMVGAQAWNMAIVNFILGFMLPGIDNYAHAGGFLGGFLMGRILDPLKPERTDHMVVALLCLGLSMLAIVASVVTLLF